MERFRSADEKKGSMMATSDLVKEAQEYERRRAGFEACCITNVQPAGDIMVNGIAHCGVVTHVCMKRDDHAGLCHCTCGYSWLGKT